MQRFSFITIQPTPENQPFLYFVQEYFHNATTNQTTWDRPTAPAAPKAAPPLPSKPSGVFCAA